jgi:hypothetical protein
MFLSWFRDAGKRRIARASGLSRFKLAGSALAILAAVCGSQCARVGDPLPPLQLIPRPAVGLQIRQVGAEIHIRFQMPTSNIDDTPVQVREVRLFRLIQADNPSSKPPDADRMSRESLRIATLESAQLEKLPGKESLKLTDSLNALRDANPFQSVFYYAVEITGRKNRSVGLSGINEFRPLAVSTPVQVRFVLQPEAVRLEWDAPSVNIDGSSPARVAGYRIYRSLGDSAGFDLPLGVSPAENPWYEDRDFVFGRTVRYAVSVMAKDAPVVESALSDPIQVEPRDIFPPAIPTQLEAFGLAEAINLRWDANRESDLKGYWLSRSENPQEIGRRITEKPIEQTSYVDRSAEQRKTYYYRLTAVDQLGNESKPSAPVAAATIPPPQ